MVMQRLKPVYLFFIIEIYCIVQGLRECGIVVWLFPLYNCSGSDGLLREWSYCGIYSVRDGEGFRASFVKHQSTSCEFKCARCSRNISRDNVVVDMPVR